MPIVSVSLNDDILSEMDSLQKALGFSGRSEIVRAGIRQLAAEEKDRQNLIGFIHALLMVVHDEESEKQVTDMKHDYDDLVQTHLHSKVRGDRCLEVFLLKGDAEDVKKMTKEFQSNKKMDHVKLISM
ncbi:MAG: CopG family ribbon-helix-helix protein [Nitrososphaera sp.]|jgi:CopG family nickel-responsive transcriptional regulator